MSSTAQQDDLRREHRIRDLCQARNEARIEALKSVLRDAKVAHSMDDFIRGLEREIWRLGG